jgi:tetratricopeptide (TPR) repeat protein
MAPGTQARAAELSAAADAARARGDVAAAIGHLEELVGLDGRATGALLRLGTLHLEQSRHGQALEFFGRALALEPGNADALCMVGVAHNDLGRPVEAIGFLEQAVAVQPGMPALHFNLALARFEAGRLGPASESLARSFALRRGEPWEGAADGRLRAGDPPMPEAEMAVNAVKIRHDCEQLAYLLERGRLPAEFRDVLAEYEALGEALAELETPSTLAGFPAGDFPQVACTYKRPLHISRAQARSMLNDALDYRRIERDWADASPHLVVIDDLLSAEGLACIREFCRESTIWNGLQGEYLGAYFFDGFHCEPLLRLAWELRDRLPAIMRGQPLQMMWGYKYSGRLTGIGLHADAAAVNANFWITPDEANRDPSRGGLVVYPHDAPPEWGFSKFNRDAESIRRFLESVGSRPIRVPYRANRIVIFDSDLFHATDALDFREGYLNRRINITLLYGLRKPPKAA